LVFTTLTKEAFPLLRYWTNDICSLHYDTESQRTHIKMSNIKGRADEIGRPILYGTTRQFLDHFGLASLKELPEHVDSTPRA